MKLRGRKRTAHRRQRAIRWISSAGVRGRGFVKDDLEGNAKLVEEETFRGIQLQSLSKSEGLPGTDAHPITTHPPESKSQPDDISFPWGEKEKRRPRENGDV